MGLARPRQRPAARAAARRGAAPGARHRSAGAGQRHRGASTRRSTRPRSRSRSRRPGEPWFCFEQPDRDGCAVAAIGCVRALEARGAGRFARCGAALVGGGRGRARRRPRRAARLGAGRGRRASRSRPTAATRPGGRASRPASLIVPELSLARARRSRVSLTVNVEAAPDDTLEDLRGAGGRATGRAARRRRCRCSIRRRPGPTGCSARCRPRTTRRRWRGRCERIRAGEFEKIVLARDVEVHAPVDHDVGRRARAAARGVRVLLRVRGRARRRGVRGRQPRAARAPGGAAGLDGRAGRLDASQRRPGDRRPPGRAAAAAATRTARRTRSSCAGSPGRCGRTRCG